MLLLGGPGGRLEERELRAQEADAGSPGGEPRVDLRQRRGIAEEHDSASVERLRRQAPQAGERTAPARAVAHGLLRLLELLASWIHREDALLSVEDEHRAVVDRGKIAPERDRHRQS